jgi:4-amino-4-deoxy-L-arabinose transferase-like glycosyltransferase
MISSMTGTRRCFILTGVLWFCFLMKLAFYASFVPLWEGYDEFAHFAFVQHLIDTHELPDLLNAGASEEVAESLRLAPVPWTIRQWTPGWTTHDDFWRLPDLTRQRRERELKEIPRTLARETAQNLRSYEAQQPPLAYLMYSIPYAVFRGAGLLTRAWVVRMAGAVIASLIIPFGFILARRVLGNEPQAVGAAAVIASMPELILTADHAGNEPLAIVLGTVCAYALCLLVGDARRALWRALLLGFLLGCGLLTKAYFLTMIPAIGGTFAVLLWRTPGSRRRIAVQLLVVLGAATAIAGWWYWRAIRVTGTLTGAQIAIAARQSTMPALRAMERINWLRVADFALVSHLWLGGWSFLVLRTWMYRIMELLLLVGQVANLRRIGNPPGRFPANLAICIAVLLSFWVGMGYYAFTTYLATREAAVFGYYAYALVVPEAVCLTAGLSALVSAVRKRFVVPGLVVCFAAMELYGTVLCLMPYYAGVTAHTARGSVPVMQVSRLLHGGVPELFRNLAVNKPDFLPAGMLVALWVGFLLAVAGIVAVSVLTAAANCGADPPVCAGSPGPAPG